LVLMLGAGVAALSLLACATGFEPSVAIVPITRQPITSMATVA